MTTLRSALFIVLFNIWTVVLGVLYLPLLLCPPRVVAGPARFWVRGAFALLKGVCGLGYRVVGEVPAGAALVAAKHQSTLETFAFRLILGDPAVILKQELLRIPFFGWYLGKTGVIAIDRAAGVKALKEMVKGAAAAAAAGRQVLIFPEGHRQEVGAEPDYHTGIAMIYAGLNLPCVPVALNTGLFWGRGSLSKRAGEATIEFLPAIPAGLDRKAFMAALQAAIEPASARLAAEARARWPHLPQ
ncbi:MAG TPA: lysophospholipid acyltransferase family protein [Magnetospirillum sp.]|nr:lysophospholipid acyltransferase family protein [Magnetospirillum sp.]